MIELIYNWARFIIDEGYTVAFSLFHDLKYHLIHFHNPYFEKINK